jgi:lipopolysaccharide export system protein LptA
VKICNFDAATRIAVLLALLVPALFGLQPTSQAETADPSRPLPAEDKKIHISARRLISNTAENTAEFIGDVRARQGETLILADSIKLFLKDDSTAKEGAPAQSLEKLVASGNVKINLDNRLAVARQAVYITAQRVLILSGPGATVSSGDNTISGETITFYREEGRFTVEGGAGGRVEAVILPTETGLE